MASPEEEAILYRGLNVLGKPTEIGMTGTEAVPAGATGLPSPSAPGGMQGFAGGAGRSAQPGQAGGGGGSMMGIFDLLAKQALKKGFGEQGRVSSGGPTLSGGIVPVDAAKLATESAAAGGSAPSGEVGDLTKLSKSDVQALLEQEFPSSGGMGDAAATQQLLEGLSRLGATPADLQALGLTGSEIAQAFPQAGSAGAGVAGGLGGLAIGPLINYLVGLGAKEMDPAGAAALQAGGQLAGSAASGAAGGLASGTGAAAGAASGLATGGLGLLASAPVIVGQFVDQARLAEKAEQAKQQIGEYQQKAPETFQSLANQASTALANAQNFQGTPQEAAELYNQMVAEFSKAQQTGQEFYTSGANWFGQNTPNVASVPQTMGPNVYSPYLQAAMRYQDLAQQGGVPITPQYTTTEAIKALNPDYFKQYHTLDLFQMPEFFDPAKAAAYQGPYKEVIDAYWKNPNFDQYFKDVLRPKYGIGSAGIYGWTPELSSESGMAWDPSVVGQVMDPAMRAQLLGSAPQGAPAGPAGSDIIAQINALIGGGTAAPGQAPGAGGVTGLLSEEERRRAGQ